MPTEESDGAVMTSSQAHCAVWALVICTVFGAPIVQDEQDAVDRLVEQFAPLLLLHPQERWMPDDVDTFLRHVHVQTDSETIVPLVNGTLPVGPDTADHYIIAELPTADPGQGYYNIAVERDTRAVCTVQ
ncbi:hypothetical protein FJT64_024905 [Amphibalanus amphitrite]|uniref:Uncharacterized protein n=1 Tax=Amphibalanus amphitrite TaxID=1232801 RepID=A0A6A4WLJ5_AMPAM|nr:hypothetical protein FJT64_024905 [Amphibalanus amphitrite]